MIEFGHREAPGIVEWGALREQAVTAAPASANAFADASPMAERIGFMVTFLLSLSYCHFPLFTPPAQLCLTIKRRFMPTISGGSFGSAACVRMLDER
jgi:hypothetical protein